LLSATSEERDVWIQKHTGFLPVTDMTRAVHETGYDGWWSLEVFNASLIEADAGCPTRHGERGIMGLRRLWDSVNQSSHDTDTRSREARRLVTPPLEVDQGEGTESESSELESVEDAKDETQVRIVERDEPSPSPSAGAPGSSLEVGGPGSGGDKRVPPEGQPSAWDGFFKKIWQRLSFGTTSNEERPRLLDSGCTARV
jgi:hypothetical protein